MTVTVTKKNQPKTETLLDNLDQQKQIDKVVADHKGDAEKVAVFAGNTFGWAIDQMRSSNIVIRKSQFNQKNGIKLIQNKRGFAFMQWSTIHNGYTVWAPNIDDMLANDWIICKLVNPGSLK